jgi:putative ABC transport system permease protein
MSWLRRIWLPITSLFSRGRLEAEMADELHFHLEMQAAEYRKRGLSDAQAVRAARRDLGGVAQVQESCRNVLGYVWLQDLFRDLKYGFRTLLRSPGFMLAAVLTLGLGIGANTAVFSVVNSVVLQPLPFHEPERLVMLWQDNAEAWNDLDQVSMADYFDWQHENRVFTSIGAAANARAPSRNFLLQRSGMPIRLRGRYASSGLFETLGVPPLLGRTFRTEEDLLGEARLVVLSHGLWRRLFASDPEVIGQTIDLGEPYQVIGVMPPRFAFPQDAELWLSWSGYPYPWEYRSENRLSHCLWVVGRLEPGVTAEQAQAEFTGLQQRIAAEHPGAARMATSVEVVPLLDQVIGSGTRPALFVLLAAVGFVLLIACANVANLLLARASVRHKELAVRVALGAGRGRVVRQLLTESLLLSLIGGGVGVLLAVWGVELLQAIRPDDTFRNVKDLRFDRVQEIALDTHVLGFTLLISLLTGLVFGLIPALQASRIDLNDALKEEGRSVIGSRRTRRFGNALLASEVALSLVLLVAAVQMLQGFARMQQVETGVQVESVIQAEIDLGMAAHRYSGSAQDVYHQMRARLEALPEVVSVSAANQCPLAGCGWQDPITIEGDPISSISEARLTDVRVVAPGSFEMFGVPILRGRDVTEDDTRDSPPVAVVNEEFARQFLGERDPIGMSFRLRGSGPFEIVGLVANVRNYSRVSSLRPEIYFAYRQKVFVGSELGPLLFVRTTGDPRRVIDVLRSAVEGSDPPGPMLNDFTLAEQVLASSASSERFQTVLLAAFAGVALVLAAVGVYGVMSYTTSQRVHEIGVRVALGAQRRDVLKLIVGRGMALALVGVAVGVPASLAWGRTTASLLYDIAVTDPVVIVTVAVVLTTVAAAACLIPARRALNVDPMVALRHE